MTCLKGAQVMSSYPVWWESVPLASETRLHAYHQRGERETWIDTNKPSAIEIHQRVLPATNLPSQRLQSVPIPQTAQPG